MATMNKTIYFHIDELARDAVVAANLERVMKPHGVRVIYGNRRLSGLIQRIDTFRKFHLYVFSGIDHFKNFVPDLTKFSAPVIILPTEGIESSIKSSKHLSTRHLGADPQEHVPWTDRVSAFCSWGPSLLNMIAAEAPELLPRCHVVGHPRHDRRCQGNSSTLHQPSEKIKVGLISRFPKFNVFDRRGMLQTVHGSRTERYRSLYLSPGREIEDQIYTEAIDLRVFFDLIQSLDPTIFELSLRVHPREDRTSWNELVKHYNLPVTLAPWDQPFMHWLKQIDHVVGPSSTSFYDCFVAGKSPISIQDISSNRGEHLIEGSEENNPIYDFVSRPKSIEELLEILSVKPETQFPPISEEVLELLKQQTNYPDSAKSIDAFSDVCLQVLESSSSPNKFGTIDRVRFEILSQGINGLTSLLRNFRRDGPEQSASFLLTPKRKSFIRKLALLE